LRTPSNQIVAKKKTFGAWSTRVVAKGLKNIHELMNCTSRALWQEVHLAEIFFYPHKLLQNPSTFSVGYVRTSGAATKHKYLQQDLQLCKVSLLQPNFSSTCGMKQRCESAFAEDTMVSESFSREEIQKCIAATVAEQALTRPPLTRLVQTGIHCYDGVHREFKSTVGNVLFSSFSNDWN